MTAQFRVVCIGAGYFSSFHRDSWSRLSHVDLVGCCDADINAARKTLLPAFDDVVAMISETNPDIADLITPPHTHLDLIEKLISLGVKTIICQKPFCANLAQARQASILAEQKNVRLIVHENFRFQPWFRSMKTLIDEGRLGAVHNFTFRLRTGDGQGPNAYLARQPYFQTMPKFLIHETGIHYIDTFRFLFGEPKSVYADLRQMNSSLAGEDAGYFIFEFGQGIRAVFDANRNLDHPSENTRLTFGEALLEGMRGSARLAGDGTVYLRTFCSLEEKIILPAQEWGGFAGDCVHALQSHVVECLKNQTEPENLASAYLANLALEEAVYQSAKDGIRLLV